jgi:hypothetical protein
MPIRPLISAAHNVKTTLAKTISIVNGLPVVNNSPTAGPFYMSISQSGTPRGFKYGGRPSELAPRQSPPAMLRHASGLTGPSVDLGAGDRVNLQSYGIYELLDGGITLTTGSRIAGTEFASLPIAILYPLTGTISDMAGNPASSITLAIYGALESHDINAGEFEDYEGEAPAEFYSSLKRNVDVMVGTRRYRVLASELDIGLMSVHLRLRRADEPNAT